MRADSRKLFSDLVVGAVRHVLGPLKINKIKNVIKSITKKRAACILKVDRTLSPKQPIRWRSLALVPLFLPLSLLPCSYV